MISVKYFFVWALQHRRQTWRSFWNIGFFRRQLSFRVFKIRFTCDKASSRQNYQILPISEKLPFSKTFFTNFLCASLSISACWVWAAPNFFSRDFLLLRVGVGEPWRLRALDSRGTLSVLKRLTERGFFGRGNLLFFSLQIDQFF